MALTSKMVDWALMKYLQIRKGRELRGKDTNVPIRLLTEYIRKNQDEANSLAVLAADILGKPLSQISLDLIQSSGYLRFKEKVDEKLSIFDNRPYQLGGLDMEIDALISVLCQMKSPDVLEIGVANGYSSAFVYFALERIGGAITSIDLPRIWRKPNSIDDAIRQRLARRGKIVNTGTLGDLNPGGVIPSDKYAGWLVPLHLREKVQNISIFGNVFNVFPELGEKKFDFVVLDAMKDYNARRKVLELIADHLRPEGVCVLDGYWVNSAFDDVCSRRSKPSWKAGRVGFFANR
jgi:SAM-dependent methyltransferase